MKSKAVVFACLLSVSVLVIASAVSEGSQEQPDKAQGAVAKENPVEESKAYCHHGCCRYYEHKCVKCCRSAAEAEAAGNTNNDAQHEPDQVDAAAYRWRGGGGGRDGWRGGGGGRHGGWRGGGGGGWRGGGGGGWRGGSETTNNKDNNAQQEREVEAAAHKWGGGGGGGWKGGGGKGGGGK